jgi:hypothetical protein
MKCNTIENAVRSLPKNTILSFLGKSIVEILFVNVRSLCIVAIYFSSFSKDKKISHRKVSHSPRACGDKQSRSAT